MDSSRMFDAIPVLDRRIRFQKRLRLAGSLWVMSLMGLLIPAYLFAIDATEYQLKAAYLYNFTRFVDWPARAFGDQNSDFRICVMGVDPFGEALSPLLQRQHDGHPITLRYPATITQARSCHLLYIAPSEAAREKAILSAVADVPVLTVSSIANFVERGGMIGFIHTDRHVRFAINRPVVQKHGLSCSAKLLEVAIKIIERENRRDRE